MKHVEFTRQLVKGKIAEIIFEQMIQNTKGYTILEFGYEKVVRQLAKQYKNDEAKDTIEIIRRAPDFAVINEKNHDINLIEVKYMNHPHPQRVLDAAKEIRKSWKKACLFVAAPHGFFFDQVDVVIANKGKIKPFTHTAIPEDIQNEYLELLNTFITHD